MIHWAKWLFFSKFAQLKADKTQNYWWNCSTRSTAGTFPRIVFSHELIESRSGFLLLRVEGNGSERLENEAGGHRWQRIPPTERKGRVQTSTITVAVLPIPTATQIQLNSKELEEHFTRGSGNGGQHRNKTDTAVVLKHLPSGLQVKVDGGRSQSINRQTAYELIQTRLQLAATSSSSASRNALRRAQVGQGQRGDKRRTVSLQRDQVVDHKTGGTCSAKEYMKGGIELLW